MAHLLGLVLACVLMLIDPAMAGQQDPGQPEQKQGEKGALKSTKQLSSDIAGDIDRDNHPGARLFVENCAGCHMGGVPKAPHFYWLEMMNSRAVLKSMTAGVMRRQAAHLTPKERLEIAEYIKGKTIDLSAPEQVARPNCTGAAARFDRSSLPLPVNWGHDTARFVPGEAAGLTAATVPNLKLKWAFAFPEAIRARSQPAIAYGAVYVGSQDGTVYAFDLKTGCTRWAFTAAAEVRTGMVLTLAGDGQKNAVPLLFFGDILARLYALNALTGELVWSRKMDDHPSATLTGTPALHDGKLFVPVSSLEVVAAADPKYDCCSFRGKVVALDARKGSLIWTAYSIPNQPTERGRTPEGARILGPSGAPVWNSPTIDQKRNLVYFGTGQNYSPSADGNSDAVIAVDMTTGERVWTRQSTAGDAWNVACMMDSNPNCPAEDGPDFDHGSSMILVEDGKGRDVLLAGHKNGTVFGLDPANKGALLWQTRVGRGSIQGGVHFGMSVDGTRLYVPINDMNDTRNRDVLDPAHARPGINALDVRDGRVLWSHVQKNICGADRPFCDPGISAAVTSIPGVVFAGHLDGYVRAYEGQTGKVLWEFDSARSLPTVNGMAGKGGGMSGAGPAVRDGYVVLNSGYGLYFHEPGNLLLVFGADGS